MTKLSVNINKIATIRNARGGDTPSVVEAAINCQKFGADGITIHPRQDERHITNNDVFDIKPIITTEVPGCIDIIPDESYGILCKPRNTSSLKKAIKRFLSLNDNKKESMVEKTYNYVKDNFDRKKILAIYV